VTIKDLFGPYLVNYSVSTFDLWDRGWKVIRQTSFFPHFCLSYMVDFPS